MPHKKPPNSTQVEEFVKAPRALECDESKERFNAALKRFRLTSRLK
jgi:hypothetical protein